MKNVKTFLFCMATFAMLATISCGKRDADSEIWGLGPDGRVYRFTDSTWTEMSSSASLTQLSVAMQGGSVMGIDTGGRIFKWNKTSNTWDEPKPDMRLNQISNLNGTTAWGIGDQGNIYVTSDGGTTWGLHPDIKLKQVSAGSISKVWGVSLDNHIKFYDGKTWTEPNPDATIFQISACGKSGAWGINDKNQIFYTEDGHEWKEPNPSSRLTQISSASDDEIWGIGDAYRILKTDDQGSTWMEPFKGAGLKQISVGHK